MRLRFWIGLIAVFIIAAGSVTAALVVHAHDSTDFHRLQREEAARAAHQAESVAALSVGQLSSAAAFFRAQGHFDQHEFDILARSLLHEEILTATGFIERVPAAQRQRYERSHGLEIVERGPDNRLRRAAERPVYFPLTYVDTKRSSTRGRGYDLGAEPERAAILMHAIDSGRLTATPVVQLILGGRGVVVYKPVYRDGAPLDTMAQRRAALLGLAAGTFQVHDLAKAAVSAVPAATAVQLRIKHQPVVGQNGELEDAARVPIHIADRTLLLVVRDPHRPDVSLPLLLGIVGIALAALLGSLIFVWSRNERMQELEREASEDPLTGLKNRRRFGEDMGLTMAQARRQGTIAALLMLDLDHFKLVNDSLGHPAGDRLIVEVAEVLRRRTRESDMLARLGGDEFAVILPRCSPGEALLAAEAIATAIREHQPERYEAAPITVSIGIAMFGDRPRTNIASVVSEADAAMYAAKDGGRDNIRFFDRDSVREDVPETT